MPIIYTYGKLHVFKIKIMDVNKLPEILTFKQTCAVLNCHVNTFEIGRRK